MMKTKSCLITLIKMIMKDDLLLLLPLLPHPHHQGDPHHNLYLLSDNHFACHPYLTAGGHHHPCLLNPLQALHSSLCPHCHPLVPHVLLPAMNLFLPNKWKLNNWLRIILNEQLGLALHLNSPFDSFPPPPPNIIIITSLDILVFLFPHSYSPISYYYYSFSPLYLLPPLLHIAPLCLF